MKREKISNKILSKFRASGIELSKRELLGFTKLYSLLVEHNSELDLTRLKTEDDIIIKHFIDSVYFLNRVSIPSPLLDIGTGPGFPGVPVKIMRPETSLILAEPRHKRVSFLKMLVEELELEDVVIYPHLVTDKSFFDVKSVITRALESVDETLSRISHFLPPGGMVYFMKGPGSGDDVGRLSGQNSRLFRLEDDITYTLPGTLYQRRLAVYRCIQQRFRKTYRIMKDENMSEGIVVTSGENKRFKQLKKLTGTDGIKKQGKVLVSGKKIIEELIDNSKISREEMIIFDGYVEKDEGFNEIIKTFRESGRLLVMKKALYNQLDIIQTEMPLLAAGIPEITEWDYTIESGCTLIIPFQDPVNTGSIIRSAAGFGIEKILLLREAANPFHPKAIRSSGGYVFRVNIVRGPSIHEIGSLAEEHNLEIVALDSGGKDLRSFQFPEKFLLLPGLEGEGVPDELKKHSVAIHLNPGVESLNASVAASIFMFQWAGDS
jgi:16S rRNA (guanine(527)-N(7))-methyltransferase RsmG